MVVGVALSPSLSPESSGAWRQKDRCLATTCSTVGVADGLDAGVGFVSGPPPSCLMPSLEPATS